jgi:hypothetical protein
MADIGLVWEKFVPGKGAGWDGFKPIKPAPPFHHIAYSPIPKVLGRQRHQVHIHRAQLIIRHVAVGFPRHVIGVDRPAVILPGVKDLHKAGLSPGRQAAALAGGQVGWCGPFRGKARDLATR